MLKFPTLYVGKLLSCRRLEPLQITVWGLAPLTTAKSGFG